MAREILCYGDSLIAGFPFEEDASWVARVQDLTGVKMANYGVCGECTDDIFWRFKAGTANLKAGHAIFSGGMNDIMAGKRAATIVGEMQKARDWCAKKGIDICLIVPWPVAETSLAPQVLALRRAMAEAFEDAFLLDLLPVFPVGEEGPVTDKEKETMRGFFIWDGVHPTAATYAKIGEYAAPLLDRWFKTQV